MCGITGAAWTARGTPVSPRELRRMTDALAHRGPDDSDVWVGGATPGGGVALGHRRLSILDLSTDGRQPMTHGPTGCRVVFNGEIYNYRELRDRLVDRGREFHTGTDTEVLLAAYAEWGADCVSHFRGMFAFGVWDPRDDSLFLARDRLGQKPLFYRNEGGRLLFGSELKSLLAVDRPSRELDPAAVDEFLLYQYVPDPRCILAGYSKLPPAHRAVWRGGALAVERYWSPGYDADPGGFPPADDAAGWNAALAERLTEAVRLRLRSDVPLGAFLSGGIDSTVICAVAQSVLGEQGAGPLKTFSIGFPEKAYDETRHARVAAAALGTEHREFTVTPDALAALPKLVRHYDEPFGDSSAIPTLALSEHTREHVTVALSGDGGDELFCGYDRYRAVRLAARFDRLPGPLRAVLAAEVWQRFPARVGQKSLRRRAKRFLAEITKPPARRYLRWIGIFDDESRRALYTDDFRDRLGDHDAAGVLADAFADCGGCAGTPAEQVRAVTCADLLTYLPGDILTKVDRASMAFGLECRSPLLDHRVAELAARMPQAVKTRDGRGKWPLRHAPLPGVDRLPPGFFDRPKMGFGVPIAPWFRGPSRPMLEDVLLGDRAAARGLFRPDAVRTLLDQHAGGKWDHAYRLWGLLVLETWLRTWLDGETGS